MKARGLLLIVLTLILITPVVRGTTCEYSLDVGDQRYCAFNLGCGELDGCSSCTEYRLEDGYMTPGVHTDDTITVNVVNNDGQWLTFDWTSNIPVTAVIVKGGSYWEDGEKCFSYVYKYDSESPRTSDNCLSAPAGTAISHITFCYVVPQITVSAVWAAELHVDQPMIADWAATPIQFTKPFGNLQINVTATACYTLGIYYTYTVNPVTSDLSILSGAMPLSFEYLTGSGTWTPIPPDAGSPVSLPVPSAGATNISHTYPIRIDLALIAIGDLVAGDSINFTLHVDFTVIDCGI